MTSIARLSGAIRTARPVVVSSPRLVPARRLSAAGLGLAVAPYAKLATYISESDYHPQFVSAAMAPGVRFSGQQIVTSLTPALAAFDNGALQPLHYNTFEMLSARDAASFISGLGEAGGAAEPEDKSSAKAFAAIMGLLHTNLSDLTVLKYGPRAVSGELATDQGLYTYLVVGRSIDGKVCGVVIGTVET